MWSILLSSALAFEPPERDAHTLELGAGALPACLAESGLSPCKSITVAMAHGDHRLPRKFLVSWTLVGERRGWHAPDMGEVHATWRLDASVGLGWHWEYIWGDMRLYLGPSIEHVRIERDTPNLAAQPGLDWLDPMAGVTGRAASWTGVGLLIGNDIDWPLGPVRLGFRWRIRLGADVLSPDADVTRGVDSWELHAASLAVPHGPVSPYIEVGWTNQFTVPFRDVQFRVAPWLVLGLQVRMGRTHGARQDASGSDP